MKLGITTCVSLLLHSSFASAVGVHINGQSDEKLSVDIDIDIKPVDAQPRRTFKGRIGVHPLRVYRYQPRLRRGSHVLGEDEADLGYEKHRGFPTESGKYLNFSNIPYAEPPLDALRFYEPIEPQTIREETNNGSRTAICPQYIAGWYGPAAEFVEDMLLNINPNLPNKWRTPITVDDYEEFKAKPELDPRWSEDCLLLDVLVPKKVWDERANSQAAVLVWIHGGGFIHGWKDQFGSPEGLLDASFDGDAIHVSINYRLGAFGFLGGEKYKEDGGTPNLGLLDQQFALRWVSRYIETFGGDPERVTVMGQSAGASSILHHITTDSSNRPGFQKAILQSPAFFPQPNATIDDLTYTKFLKASGAKDLEELQNANTSTLMQANADLTWNSSYGLFQFGPTVDGSYVPDLPSKRLKSGSFHSGITLLVGHQKFDGLIFTPPWIRSDEDLEAHVRELYPNATDAVFEFIKTKYHIRDFAWGKEKLLKVSDFLDDIAVQCNSYWLTDAMVNGPYPVPVFRYAFNVVPALHGHDLSYTYFPSYPSTPDVDPALAKTWQTALMNFTQFGDPSADMSTGPPGSSPAAPPLALWPLYEIKTRKVMNFGDPKKWFFPNDNSYEEGDDVLDRGRCDFWADAPYFPKSAGGLVEQEGGRQDL